MTPADPKSDGGCRRIPLDLYPSFNPFALDLVRDSSNATTFVSRSDLGEISPKRPGRELRELGAALARTNREWGNDVGSLVDAWLDHDTVTLIAGQQTGFAGGPIYTLAKIASLLKLRRDFESRGTRATPFFWLATEDHDFDEVARLDVVIRGRHERLRASSPPSRKMVGERVIPEELRGSLRDLLDGETPSWLEPGLTFRDSFARLIAETVPGEIILVDSLLPELRSAGQPLFAELIDALATLNEEISIRSGAIEEAGYRPQILPSSHGYTAMYAIDDRGERNLIHVEEGRAVAEGWEVDLRELARTRPERISTAALTRPLLQDYVFRPQIFVGGPAEVSYYAQLGPLYQRFSIEQPHVALRGHALVAPRKVLRAIEKYGMEHSEIFDPVDQVLLRRESHRDDELAAIIEELKGELDERIDRISELVLPVDRSMKRSIERTSRRIRYHYDQLQRRGRRAIARFDEDRHSALERLHLHLCPADVPQDRTVGWIGYWNAYGPLLVDGIVSEIQPDSDHFKLIGL